jgi:hypothetical protein
LHPHIKWAIRSSSALMCCCCGCASSHHILSRALITFPRNRLSPRFINKATTSIQGSPIVRVPNIKQKRRAIPRCGDTRQSEGMVRWRAASCRAHSMQSTRAMSRCLHNGYHSCKEANIMNTDSEARRGNTFSITILLRVIHKVQDITANMNQKRQHLIPVWFA